MITFRMTKKDYRKAVNQMFWQDVQGVLIFWAIVGVIYLIRLIGKIRGGSWNHWVTDVILWLVLFCVLLFKYLKAVGKVRKLGEYEYTLTYSPEEVSLYNETTAEMRKLKINEIILKQKSKSFLFFQLNGEKAQLLIMPRNDDTKEFENLFSQKETPKA